MIFIVFVLFIGVANAFNVAYLTPATYDGRLDDPDFVCESEAPVNLTCVAYRAVVTPGSQIPPSHPIQLQDGTPIANSFPEFLTKKLPFSRPYWTGYGSDDNCDSWHSNSRDLSGRSGLSKLGQATRVCSSIQSVLCICITGTTSSPTKSPSGSPSKAPTTSRPTRTPSRTPTTTFPTQSPTKPPTFAPSGSPTSSPSINLNKFYVSDNKNSMIKIAANKQTTCIATFDMRIRCFGKGINFLSDPIAGATWFHYLGVNDNNVCFVTADDRFKLYCWGWIHPRATAAEFAPWGKYPTFYYEYVGSKSGDVKLKFNEIQMKYDVICANTMDERGPIIGCYGNSTKLLSYCTPIFDSTSGIICQDNPRTPDQNDPTLVRVPEYVPFSRQWFFFRSSELNPNRFIAHWHFAYRAATEAPTSRWTYGNPSLWVTALTLSFNPIDQRKDYVMPSSIMITDKTICATSFTEVTQSVSSNRWVSKYQYTCTNDLYMPKSSVSLPSRVFDTISGAFIDFIVDAFDAASTPPREPAANPPGRGAARNIFGGHIYRTAYARANDGSYYDLFKGAVYYAVDNFAPTFAKPWIITPATGGYQALVFYTLMGLTQQCGGTGYSLGLDDQGYLIYITENGIAVTLLDTRNGGLDKFTATKIWCGEDAYCFLTLKEEFMCAGKNGYGQISRSGSASYLIQQPQQITDFGRAMVLDVVFGVGHTCFMFTDGYTSCIGRNDFGQRGGLNIFPSNPAFWKPYRSMLRYPYLQAETIQTQGCTSCQNEYRAGRSEIQSYDQFKHACYREYVALGSPVRTTSHARIQPLAAPPLGDYLWLFDRYAWIYSDTDANTPTLENIGNGFACRNSQNKITSDSGICHANGLDTIVNFDQYGKWPFNHASNIAENGISGFINRNGCYLYRNRNQFFQTKMRMRRRYLGDIYEDFCGSSSQNYVCVYDSPWDGSSIYLAMSKRRINLVNPDLV